MTEFQEKLRQQHKESMHRELQALIRTASDPEAEVRKSNAPKTIHTGSVSSGTSRTAAPRCNTLPPSPEPPRQKGSEVNIC